METGESANQRMTAQAMKSDKQPDFLTFFIRHIPVDVRFGEGGCRGEIRLRKKLSRTRGIGRLHLHRQT